MKLALVLRDIPIPLTIIRKTVQRYLLEDNTLSLRLLSLHLFKMHHINTCFNRPRNSNKEHNHRIILSIPSWVHKISKLTILFHHRHNSISHVILTIPHSCKTHQPIWLSCKPQQECNIFRIRRRIYLGNNNNSSSSNNFSLLLEMVLSLMAIRPIRS